jgi:hypothetical protein
MNKHDSNEDDFDESMKNIEAEITAAGKLSLTYIVQEFITIWIYDDGKFTLDMSKAPRPLYYRDAENDSSIYDPMTSDEFIITAPFIAKYGIPASIKELL